MTQHPLPAESHSPRQSLISSDLRGKCQQASEKCHGAKYGERAQHPSHKRKNTHHADGRQTRGLAKRTSKTADLRIFKEYEKACAKKKKRIKRINKRKHMWGVNASYRGCS